MLPGVIGGRAARELAQPFVPEEGLISGGCTDQH
jgi:hypothetical protein